MVYVYALIALMIYLVIGLSIGAILTELSGDSPYNTSPNDREEPKITRIMLFSAVFWLPFGILLAIAVLILAATIRVDKNLPTSD